MALKVTANCDVVVQSPGVKVPTLLSRKIRNILINLSLMFYIIFSILLNGLFTPFVKRGFFCSDVSIHYPIKSDTVSFKMLLVFALLLPSIIIKVCDKTLRKLSDESKYRPARLKKNSNSQTYSINEDQEMLGIRGDVKRRLVVNEDDDAEEDQNLCKVYDSSDDDAKRSPRQQTKSRVVWPKSFTDLQLFMFGFATTSLFTGIGKTTCGRLRPHFMQRCKPNIDCSLPENNNRYIEDFTCTNDLRQRDITYISTSWPSGHASIIFYSMLYMICYLNTVIPVIRHLRQTSRTSSVGIQPLMLGCVYPLLVAIAIYISTTRISDYHHHPTDVFSGSVIGSLIAIIQAKCLLKPLHENIFDI